MVSIKNSFIKNYKEFGKEIYFGRKNILRLGYILLRKIAIKAYSRPILCSTIKCCTFCWRLCKALFWWKTLRKGIEKRGEHFGGLFFKKKAFFKEKCHFFIKSALSGQYWMLPQISRICPVHMRSAKKVVFIILWSPLRLALANASLKLDSYIYTRYQVWFYLWWIKPKLRLCCKVPKYYAEDCNSILLPAVSRKFVFK